MENPYHWPESTKVIDLAILEWERDKALQFHSLAEYIRIQLVKSNLLKEGK